MLRLSLLGEQRLTRRGTDLAAGGSRAVELLAYLVLHPGIQVPRAVLAGTFWPDTPQPQAMTNLRRELHNLRLLLGGIEVLGASDGAIGWVPRAGLGVDVHVFSTERAAALLAAQAHDPAGFLAHAQAALRQYRGDLMPGNYSDWVPEPRERILRECTSLCDATAAALSAAGEGQAALEVAGRRVTIQPLEEVGHRGLIRAHLALGDRPAALHAFRRCAEVLEGELGVLPAAETRALLGMAVPSRGERLANRGTPSVGTGTETHTATGGKTMEEQSTSATGTQELFAPLRASLRGTLALPQDPGYDAARAVYNGMVDHRPAAIARVADTADIIACVNFARANQLEPAVRGGGHQASGMSVADGSLVIDLGALRSTTVDPAARTVRVDGGAVWGDVDHATVAFGMAVPSGFIASTGVGGLALGGGIGYLTRRYGLTVDNLLAADVVLADGTLVKADEAHNADLFWALRGGGGNFGIVTSFTFRMNEIGEHGTIIGGPVFYDLADTPAVMRWYRELLPALPEELSGWFGLLTIPPAPPFPEELWGRKVCGIIWCYTGAHEMAEKVLAPVRGFGSPLVVGLAPMPFDALQRTFDPLFPAGLQWYWRADFVKEISDAAIGIHARYGAALPTGYSTMHLYPIDGAAARVPKDATAFAYRDGGWAGVIVGVDPDAANAELITAWTKSYYDELHPTTAGGAYVNFMMEEGTDRIRASYLHNYDRLARVKAQYDPANLFHHNQNIAPATVG